MDELSFFKRKDKSLDTQVSQDFFFHLHGCTTQEGQRGFSLPKVQILIL